MRALLVIAALAAASPAFAARTDDSEQLAIEAEERALEAEGLTRDAAEVEALNARDEAVIAEIARQVARYELEIEEARARLVALADEEAIAVETLRRRREADAAAFTAMLALAKAEAPALIAYRGNVENAARGASALYGLREALRESARETARQRALLDDLRLRTDAAREQAKAAIQRLRAKERELWDMIGKRKRVRIDALAEADALREEAERLKEQSAALREMLQSSPPPPPKPLRATFVQAPRVLPDRRPIAEAVGAMVPPVIGQPVTLFGQRQEDGPPSEGLVFQAAPHSRVYAPWDGVVSFAGPVKSLGLVVIIDLDDGSQLVLGGMSVAERRRGEPVLRGEPVGRLSGPLSKSEEFLVEQSAIDPDAVSYLYFQFRRDGRPVDPAPWLETTRKVSAQ